VILLVTSDVWDQAMAAAAGRPGSSGMTAQSLANTVKVVAVVAVSNIVGLYLLFALKMRAGRNWARIVLTVLSALSIGSTAHSSTTIRVNDQAFTASTSQAVGWFGAALAVVAIVLMFMPASNAYFAAGNASGQR